MRSKVGTPITTTSTTERRCVTDNTPLTGQQRRFCRPECAKEEARRVRLDNHFAITPAEYEAILQHQGGGCAVCGRKPKPGKRLAVDHDHQTGLIRGLLDYVCNRRLLGARTAENVVRLAEYVTNPPARSVIGDRVAPGRPPKARKRRTTRPPRKKATR